MTSSAARLLAGLRDAGRLGTGAGRKAATLGRLAAVGFPVPEGLVLTAAAFDELQASAGLPAGADPETIRSAPWPGAVRLAVDEIAAHFADVPLAVRSSGVEEDLAGDSYAGQYTTVLRVRGAQELRAAVRECWASAAASTVRSYRKDHGTPRVAVLVQPMVEADVAGVAFTADPLTGERDEVLVSAVPGTAEHLADGTLTPDEWRVRGDAATPTAVQHQALTEQQAVAVADLARRVEAELGGPQDVEWAMASRRLLLLQARPVTALPRPAPVDLPEGTWVKEVERHPEPLTAYGASLVSRSVSTGLTEMAASWGALVERFEARSIGGEPYLQVTPAGGRAGPPPPWWLLGALTRLVPPLRARMRTARRMLRPGSLTGALEAWDSVHRPRIRDEHARLAAVDLGALDDPALAAHLDGALEFGTACMRLHFWLVPPYAVPVFDLAEFCRTKLGWDDARALQLLAGTSTATDQPHRELRRVADLVRGDRQAREAVAAAPADLYARLAAVAPHAAEALDEWVRRYALRCINDDPGSPTLGERPELVAHTLHEAVCEQSSGAGARQVREQAKAQARQALAGRPAGTRRHFEELLARATRAYPLREESAFWTGSMTGGLMRRAAVESGRRLAARGLLRDPEDAVHLDVHTLRSLLGDTGTIDPETGQRVREQVARARAQRAWARAHPGPAYHGPAPAPPPDFRGLPRAGRRLNQALEWARGANQGGPGTGGAPRATREATLLGLPGSPGRHTGPVRVVRGEPDFAKVRSGDVLVCATTDPAWSVLFGVAGALVTDHGGVLSHAAIVAREFGIPAVLGTGHGTTVLREGQQVTVQGGTGRVVLEAEADPPGPVENNTPSLEMT